MEKKPSVGKRVIKRPTFRHGDLRRALLDAGVELARSGGPSAIVLREATRRAGVAPNAAYRHFANHNELLKAVRAYALSRLARAIETRIKAIPRNIEGADSARARLRAVGIGYLTFALRERGLFRTAFSSTEPIVGDTDKDKSGTSGLNPFQLLGAALDSMVQNGILPAGRRANAEFLAWSAVHGMAFLVLDGPLCTAPMKEITRLSERLITMVEKGL
jgi:AcrR family transcriptional regulator